MYIYNFHSTDKLNFIGGIKIGLSNDFSVIKPQMKVLFSNKQKHFPETRCS